MTAMAVGYAEGGFLPDDAAVDAFAQVILESGGVIEGDVLIGEEVTSLEGLEGLVTVGGDLSIRDNPQLTSLSGLEGLTRVSGNIYVEGNTNLASLTGLANLERVGGRLILEKNPKLLSEAGLESAMAVGGGYQDLNVADFSGSLLQAVASLPTDFVDEVDVLLILEDNASIAAVGDFVSKRGGVFSESLKIFANGTGSTSLENLSSLTRVDGDLYLSDRLSLDPLSGLTLIGGALSICQTGWDYVVEREYEYCDDEAAIPESLANLASVGEGFGGVYTSNTLDPFAALFGEPILQSLQSLPALGEGDFDLLLTLDSDASVSAVGDFVATTGGMFPGSLEITGNGVTSLVTLEALREVRGNLYISADQLPSLAGLESLTSVGGDLEIGYNEFLSSISSLQGLTAIGEDLAIIFNDQLSSLAGLEALTRIGKSLSIRRNAILSSLSGLESLSQVGEDIDIEVYNIDNVDGLKDAPLTQVGGTINIDWNENSQPIRSLEALREL